VQAVLVRGRRSAQHCGSENRKGTAAMDGQQNATDSPATRARYFNPANIFTLKRPDIPCRVFHAELDRALDSATPTSWIACDIGAEIGCDYAATTPLILARYAKIAPGATLTGAFRATGEIYYAIAGSGRAAKVGETIDWQAGDFFALPGGGESVLTAGPDGAVLFMVTNEPELAHQGCEPPRPENAPVAMAHYPGAEIDRQLQAAHDAQVNDPNVAGQAVQLTSPGMAARGTIHPTIACAINSLDAHLVQRPHRHNSAAVTLPLFAEGVHSVIEGQRVDWRQYAAMITPPAALHSHINDGDGLMKSMVIQDGGLYYHCRTIGFSFD
jgi:gentisate 1,2-dioxygenase